jgi:hypothetical protein
MNKCETKYKNIEFLKAKIVSNVNLVKKDL